MFVTAVGVSNIAWSDLCPMFPYSATCDSFVKTPGTTLPSHSGWLSIPSMLQLAGSFQFRLEMPTQWATTGSER